MLVLLGAAFTANFAASPTISLAVPFEVMQDGDSHTGGDETHAAETQKETESSDGHDHGDGHATGTEDGHGKADGHGKTDGHAGGDHHDVAGDHGHGEHNYLSPEHLFSHVQDSTEFHFSPMISRMITGDSKHNGHIVLPNTSVTRITIPGLEKYVKPLDLKLTRFMVVELLAAGLIFVVFTFVARRVSAVEAPRGRLINLFEAMIQFIRVDVAKAVIGKKD